MTNNLTGEKLERAGLQAAINFLKRRNYKVLETNYTVEGVGAFDIVAATEYGERIAFIDVFTRDCSEYKQSGKSGSVEEIFLSVFDHKHKTREQFENMLFHYLLDYSDENNRSYRYDLIENCVIDYRVLSKHTINVFGLINVESE